MNTATDSLETDTPITTGGFSVGQSATDLVGFYGATPIAKPTSASQATISSVVNLNGATGDWSSGIAVCTATYASAVVNSAIATLAQNNNNMRTLVHQLRAELREFPDLLHDPKALSP